MISLQELKRIFKMIIIPVFKNKTKWTTMVVYGACLAFCIHYLTALRQKRYSTYFEMKETNFSKPNLSLCFPLYIHFNFNCSEADSELVRSGCTRFFKLYYYYNDESDKARTPKSILQYADQLRLNESYTVSDSYLFESYYLNFNYLCLKYSLREVSSSLEDDEDEDEPTFSVTVQNNFNIPFIVFFHEERFIYFFYNYFFRQRFCRVFRSCKSFEFQIEQYQFNFLKAPYGGHCVDYKQMQFPEYTNPVDNEEIGLIECVKHAIDRPISLFYFTLNDDKHFLYLPTNYASSPILKELPKSGIYRNCSRKFRRRDCNKVIHIITEQLSVSQSDNLTFHFKENAKVIDETGLIEEFDYCLQVLGFISLIFGISLNSSMSYICTALTIHLNPKALISNVLFCVRWFLVFAGLYVVLLRTGQMFSSYRDQQIYTIMYFNYLFDHEQVSLYVCFPVASTVKGHEQIDDRELANATNDLLSRYRLSELFEMLVPPSELIERIYLTDGLRQKNLSIQEFDSEVFRMAKYESISARIFSKCFNYHIKLKLPTYQRLLKSTALKIRFKVNQTAFFFTDIDQPTVRSDTQLLPTDYISRHQFISNKHQCRDYRTAPERVANFTCVSQENCLDECVIERYLKAFGHLSVLSVIHQSNFDKFAHLKFTHENFTGAYLEHERYVSGEEHRESFLKFENECRQLFAEKDCNTVRYRSTNKKVTVQRVQGEVSFDMFFLSFIYRQNDYLTAIPFISNLLTLWCIMIDVSFSNLFGLLLNWLRGRLRKDLTIAFLNSKLASYQFRHLQLKILRLLKDLMVFLLFLGSLAIIIFETFDNELIHSIYFDVTTDKFDFPVTGFCFDLCERYRQYRDENLTGHKLDAITSKLDINDVLDRVEYINSSHRNTTWTHGEQFDKNMRIEHFYYLRKKCFSFEYDLNTTDNEHLITDYALHIYFKPNLKFKTIFYFTKVKDEESFSQFHNLNASNFMYTIRFGSCSEIIQVK